MDKRLNAICGDAIEELSKIRKWYCRLNCDRSTI